MILLSWGKSASWLMPGLTKVAEVENPPPSPPQCDLEAWRGVSLGRGHPESKAGAWSPGLAWRVQSPLAACRRGCRGGLGGQRGP